MTTEKKLLAVLAAYAIAAIVTYGHAWENLDSCEIGVFTGNAYRRDSADRFMLSTLSAVFWPLYTSMKAFEKSKLEDCK